MMPAWAFIIVAALTSQGHQAPIEPKPANATPIKAVLLDETDDGWAAHGFEIAFANDPNCGGLNLFREGHFDRTGLPHKHWSLELGYVPNTREGSLDTYDRSLVSWSLR